MTDTKELIERQIESLDYPEHKRDDAEYLRACIMHGKRAIETLIRERDEARAERDELRIRAHEAMGAANAEISKRLHAERERREKAEGMLEEIDLVSGRVANEDHYTAQDAHDDLNVIRSLVKRAARDYLASPDSGGEAELDRDVADALESMSAELVEKRRDRIGDSERAGEYLCRAERAEAERDSYAIGLAAEKNGYWAARNELTNSEAALAAERERREKAEGMLQVCEEQSKRLEAIVDANVEWHDAPRSPDSGGEAEPVAWATVRVEDTGDGLIIHPDDAKKWGLTDDLAYEGRFLPDGRYRIALPGKVATTPPASTPAVTGEDIGRVADALDELHQQMVDTSMGDDHARRFARCAIMAFLHEDCEANDIAVAALARKEAVPDGCLNVGHLVTKHKGYPYPGEVRAVFKTKAGLVRYVVEATGEDYAGMLHIFAPGQLDARKEAGNG